ncbi:MAG: ECF RNA polymerase sigma factor SigK [Nocardioides sp.]|uniref:ECF RNA polymerase sigma factor SigK n=1 Tax=Nocardioides sp. TaxID=35761 RepID=UPI0039E5E249
MDHLEPVPDGSPAGDPSGAARPEQPELADLLRRSARGDEEAFAAVYDAVASRAYGLALSVVRDPAQAEEVVQEALFEVWRTASRFDARRGTPLGWILTILHRRAVDRVRASEAATRRDRTYHERNQTVSHDATAEAAHASMEAHRVRRALDTLTPVQRQAVELAYLRGYTHTEVAQLLELPVGTAKTRIRDGMIRLRDTLGVGGGR